MPKIDHLTKLEIVRLFKTNRSVASIKRHFEEKGKNLSRQTIEYHLKKFRNGDFDDGFTDKLDKVPTPKFQTITESDLEFIKKCLEQQPVQSSQNIKKSLQTRGLEVGNTTTRKAIYEAGYTCSSPRYCQMIRDANKLKRVAFCNHLISTNDSLDNVIFTDETTVQLFHNKSVAYHPIGSIPIHVSKPKHPLKVHVWAGISRRGPTHAIVFDGIMDASFFTNKILEKKLLRFVKNVYPEGHRFQQDNDPKHTSRLAKTFMTANGINWWQWPAESPDLNPIEMLWSEMKRDVSKRNPSTQKELIDAILDFWKTVNVETCNRYIDHVYKVAPVCSFVKGRATGDIPGRLFMEQSSGKSFKYFQDLLESKDYQDRIGRLLSDRVS